MVTKDQLAFILKLTDFIHGHWEDPEWGRRVQQLVVHLNTYTAASSIEDKDVRAAIQGQLEKSVRRIAPKLASTNDPVPPAPRSTNDPIPPAPRSSMDPIPPAPRK